jgi:hypothetical protein
MTPAELRAICTPLNVGFAGSSLVLGFLAAIERGVSRWSAGPDSLIPRPGTMRESSSTRRLSCDERGRSREPSPDRRPVPGPRTWRGPVGPDRPGHRGGRADADAPRRAPHHPAPPRGGGRAGRRRGPSRGRARTIATATPTGPRPENPPESAGRGRDRGQPPVRGGQAPPVTSDQPPPEALFRAPARAPPRSVEPRGCHDLCFPIRPIGPVRDRRAPRRDAPPGRP